MKWIISCCKTKCKKKKTLKNILSWSGLVAQLILWLWELGPKWDVGSKRGQKSQSRYVIDGSNTIRLTLFFFSNWKVQVGVVWLCSGRKDIYYFELKLVKKYRVSHLNGELNCSLTLKNVIITLSRKSASYCGEQSAPNLTTPNVLHSNGYSPSVRLLMIPSFPSLSFLSSKRLSLISLGWDVSEINVKAATS